MNIDWSVVILLIEITLAAFVAVSTWRINQRKQDIEYWQGVAKDLKARVESLELQAKRQATVIDFLIEHVDPAVARIAREMLLGIIERKKPTDEAG